MTGMAIHELFVQLVLMLVLLFAGVAFEVFAQVEQFILHDFLVSEALLLLPRQPKPQRTQQHYNIIVTQPNPSILPVIPYLLMLQQWGRLIISPYYHMRFNTLLCLALTLLLANAWWDKGHMLVSQIAYNHLSDTKQTAARDKFNSLIVAFNPFTDGRSQSFAQAAVWADDIKEYGATIFDNYHFTNIPYDPDFTFKGMTEYQQDVNAVNIINWCNSVLSANKDGTSFQRAFMARYLLHLIGDIHQPLHSTMMFNATYKTGDLGGNLIHILTPNGTDMNLHAYFDSIALDQDPVNRIERPLNDTFRAFLETQARTIMTQYSFDSLSDLANIKDAHTWGVEAFKIAVDKIYSYTKTHKQVTEQYQNQIREVLFRQIALGGYRLAMSIAALMA